VDWSAELDLSGGEAAQGKSREKSKWFETLSHLAILLYEVHQTKTISRA